MKTTGLLRRAARPGSTGACLLALVALAAGLMGCAGRPKTPLIVFTAGSLIGPFEPLEKAYEAAHPDVDVQMEAHGSIRVMRHVTDTHEPIDVVATADQHLIRMLMYGANDPNTGKPYASWYVKFATNRMVRGYTERSRYAGEINADNWYAVLARPGVRVGLSDPRFDPPATGH